MLSTVKEIIPSYDPEDFFAPRPGCGANLLHIEDATGDEDDDDDDDDAGVGAGASTAMDVDEPECEEKDAAELAPVLMREYLASGAAVKGRTRRPPARLR